MISQLKEGDFMERATLPKLLFNRRVMIILFIGFSSGLPLVLTGSTLQAWYTAAGVNLMTIGILSLVGQPYIYKPLWAPFLDRFIPLNIGKRRSWIVLTQLALAISLGVMAFMHPVKTPWLLASIALLVAFFSATQDVAVDAYRTDLLSVSERGLGASMNSVGYRLAMLVSGALALVLAQEIGWKMTYLIMSGLMVMQLLITLFFAPNPAVEMPRPKTLTKAIIEPFKEFLTRKNAIAIIIFVIIYKICDALALSLNTTFLMRGVHFSLLEIGTISKFAALIGALLGSIVGGVLYPYLGLYRSLMYFGLSQMLSNLSFALLAIVGKSYFLMGGSIFLDYFCGSLSGVAFIVFLMSLCNQHYTATQYALLSALTAIGRVFVGPIAAIIVERSGWVEFYLWTFIVGLPALFLLWWLNRRIDFSAEKIAQVSQ